jgi:hypothetical protein
VIFPKTNFKISSISSEEEFEVRKIKIESIETEERIHPKRVKPSIDIEALTAETSSETEVHWK